MIICSKHTGIVLTGVLRCSKVWKKYDFGIEVRQTDTKTDRQLTGMSFASFVIICSKYAGIVLIGGPVLVIVWKKYGLRLTMSRRARHA